MKFKEVRVRNKQGVEFVLRSPRPEEAQLMIDHMRITAAESYRNLNQTPAFWNAMTFEEERKILTGIEASTDRFLICAFTGERIVGGLGFFGLNGEFLSHTGRIGMSLQRAYCGAGLGQQMLKHALAEARARDYHRVELTVRAFNEEAIALYEKIGFERVGRLKDVAYIDGAYVDEFLYQMLLT